MIVLTVKTLDSQNHTFTVDDDITVVEFKAKIADTVNIPADTQRIIYCGRVLQDDVKLSDYDVNGKVVHLVQRPPPSANAPSSNRSASPQPPRRGGFRTFESGNTMYLGSMAFPSNLMESQGIVPPPPTHSLAGSRLNVARRMLRRAETVINSLENPTARQNEQPNNEEQPEEEVTPIIEARVIVPSGGEGPIDEAMVLSAVQNSLFNATNSSMPVSAEVTVETSPASHSPTGTPPAEPSASTTPEEQLPEGEASAGAAPPASSSAETGTSASNGDSRNGGVSARTLAENASRTTEMAQLLVTLNQLQERFAPFLERYRCFMIEDPVIPTENVRQTQLMLTRVSEVLHFLGHAYHSLSDIIIRVRTPPPRPLLCRPILIQHSAVVQAGIPIQVEVAQINLSAERPNASNGQNTTGTASATTTTTTTTATASDTEPSAPPAAPSADGTAAAPAAAATSNQSGTGPQQPNVQHINIHSFSNNFPFVPAASMRMQSFPIELRSALRNPNGNNGPAAGTSTRGAPNNNNNNNTAGTTGGENATPNATATTTSARNAPPQPNAPPLNMGNFFTQSGSSDNPVEFFMEVSPDVLRGSMASPPTNLMQSLMHIAGQFMTQQVNNPPGGATGPAAPAAPTGSADGQQQSANSTQQGSQGNASAVPGQNSQARGNTQTNPTTATHTRSTPRPHVHLAQQAMQGGFDPFLPCNSHHVTHRRRGGGHHTTVHHLHPATATPPASASSQEGTPSDTPASSSPRSGRGAAAAGASPAGGTTLQYLMEEIYNSLRTAYGPRRRNSEPGPNTTAAGQPPGQQQQQQPGDATSETSTPPPSGTGAPPPSANRQRPFEPAQPWPTNQRFRMSPTDLMGAFNMDPPGGMPTLADLLRHIPTGEDPSAQGESIITDLIMLMTRHLTLIDLISITTGNYESLQRVYPEVHSFVSQRILNGPNTPENVNTGVERLIEELEPFLQSFSALRTRENIDIVRTIERLFRRRLPDIVVGLATVNPTNVRIVVNNCMNLAKMIVGLCLYASANGQPGVEETFQNLIQSYMQGIPNELQAWTTFTSFSNLRFYISNNPYVESDFLPYIVRNDESTMLSRLPSQTDAARGEPLAAAEPMEVDLEEPIETVAEAETAPIDLLQSQPPLSVGDADEPLPNVVIGTEPWHAQVPENWVPIITRDVQRQRRQPPQRPYSDAYLSGMPTKKRKLVNGSKPQGSLPQVISDSVRRAVAQTGLNVTTVPLETVAQAAGNSSEIQNAYRNLLRTSVQSALENNDDFTPERFPNASAYFKPPKP